MGGKLVAKAELPGRILAVKPLLAPKPLKLTPGATATLKMAGFPGSSAGVLLSADSTVADLVELASNERMLRGPQTITAEDEATACEGVYVSTAAGKTKYSAKAARRAGD